MKQTNLFADEDAEYDLEYIINNPIPSVCKAGKHHFCKDKVENIRAPSLTNVRCFWCSGEMKPADPKAYKERIANLWQHIANDEGEQVA